MPNIVSQQHLQCAQRLKQLYSRYQQSRDLISVGAYVAGSDPETDAAIELLPAIKNFLQQRLNDADNVESSVLQLQKLIMPPNQSPNDVQANGGFPVSRGPQG